MDDKLNTIERKELPDSVFGLPERREYPMPDAAHVRAAEAYFRYCPDDLKPKNMVSMLKVQPYSPTLKNNREIFSNFNTQRNLRLAGSRILGIILSPRGKMAERLNALVLKTSDG